MKSCIFCQIAHKKIPSHIVDENEFFIAFLSIYPNTLGTTVVIPKEHYASYAFDLDDQILSQLICYAKKVALKLDDYFDDVGRTALVLEGFGVDHVHAKLFPMHETSQQHQHWTPIKSSVNQYFKQYQGYISSHDGAEADPSALQLLAAKIRDH